jgi:hypothetical protein
MKTFVSSAVTGVLPHDGSARGVVGHRPLVRPAARREDVSGDEHERPVRGHGDGFAAVVAPAAGRSARPRARRPQLPANPWLLAPAGSPTPSGEQPLMLRRATAESASPPPRVGTPCSLGPAVLFPLGRNHVKEKEESRRPGAIGCWKLRFGWGGSTCESDTRVSPGPSPRRPCACCCRAPNRRRCRRSGACSRRSNRGSSTAGWCPWRTRRPGRSTRPTTSWRDRD